MNSNKRIKSTIQAISSSPLFMEKNAAMNLMHRYNSLIDSKVFENEQLTEKHLEKMEELTSVSFHSASKSVVLGKFGNDFKDVPSGSVAVVPVMGVMARDTYCSMSNGYISGTRDTGVVGSPPSSLDNKLIPSAEVATIFNAINQAYSLEGDDRMSIDNVLEKAANREYEQGPSTNAGSSAP